MNLFDRDVRDSTPVIFISILMFFIPKDPNFIHSFSKDRKRPRDRRFDVVTFKEFVPIHRREETTRRFGRFDNVGRDRDKNALELNVLVRRWIRYIQRQHSVLLG